MTIIINKLLQTLTLKRKKSTRMDSKFFFLLYIVKIVALRKSIIVSRTEYNVNPKYVMNVSDHLEQNDSYILVNVDFYVISEVKYLTLNTVIYKFDREYKPSILNDTINVCKALKDVNKAQYNYFLKKFYTTLTDFSNAIRCNFKVTKKVYYILKFINNFIFFCFFK